MPAIVVFGQLLLTALMGYLWGSIPAGYWMGKLLRGKNFDIRNYGSHKTGATNVLRILGKGAAIVVLIVDLSKGIGPVLLATYSSFFYVMGWGPTVAGIAALLGHCCPVFIGFKGGRGVLTGSGALLVISPLSFFVSAIITLLTIATTRYVSLGSILGSLTSMACGIVFFFIGIANPTFFGRVSLPQLVFLVIAPALVVFFHSDNISRLLNGTERKIGQKENTTASPTTSPT